MYEYQIITHYGQSPPSSLCPPSGFRLRDIQFVETGSAQSNYGGGTTTTVSGLWLIVWERYVPEQGEQ